MKPHEALRNLHLLGPQDAHVIASYFADHFLELRLVNGAALVNITDVQYFLREFAIAARIARDYEQSLEVAKLTEFQPGPKLARMPLQRSEDVYCPNCGHVHLDDSECNFPIGGGRYCRCERNVVA